jgi:hypothetical protein
MTDLLPLMLNHTMWYDLGRIVAVDLFIGNNDRFALLGNDTGRTRGTMSNPGNILFLHHMETAIVLGLDTWDQNNKLANLNTAIEGRHGAELEFAKLDILMFAGPRKKIRGGMPPEHWEVHRKNLTREKRPLLNSAGSRTDGRSSGPILISLTSLDERIALDETVDVLYRIADSVKSERGSQVMSRSAQTQ